jgi:conjugal transfer pilus assembly protein TraF
MIKFLIFILMAIVPCAYSTERQGPHYYQFDTAEKDEEESNKQDVPPTNTQVVAKLRAIYDEALNASIISPTEKNILKERMLSTLYMDLAQRYQETSQMVVAKNPQINYMLRYPTDDAARKHHDIMFDKEVALRVAGIAKTHGLFFFYSSSCPHCRLFAPTLLHFAKKYGFEVIPISVDGNILPEFPNSRINDGQAQFLGVQTLPAVFAIDPSNVNNSLFVSYGNVSVLELTEKLDYNYRRLTGKIHYEVLK